MKIEDNDLKILKGELLRAKLDLRNTVSQVEAAMVKHERVMLMLIDRLQQDKGECV